MKANIYLLVFLTLITLAQARGQTIHEFMDLQTHLTMGQTYSFFGESFRAGTDREIEALTHKHMFKYVNYMNTLKQNPGSRIIINGAIPFEFSHNRNKIKQGLLKQIESVDAFAAANSKHFVVARSPREVRHLIHSTNKTVILHSIEGVGNMIQGPEDAKFWASKGVAFITLIHLVDGDYGGAGRNPGLMGKLINLRGTLKKIFHPGSSRGLTAKGRDAIRWLAQAGIMTDLTHMSSEAVDDALDVLEELKLPPLATHSHFSPVQNNERAITPAQLTRIYQLGGLFSLPISGKSTSPKKPSDEFLDFISGQKLCIGSLDSYRVTFQFAQHVLLDHFVGRHPWELTPEEKINYALGWQSDFDGWLDHSRPRYGKDGCYKNSVPTPGFEAIETKGLAHPGLLPQYWRLLQQEGMDVESLRFASEKFLRMWDKFRSYSLVTRRAIKL